MKNNEATVHIKQCYLEMFKDYPDVVDHSIYSKTGKS
jgi:hypothetical protein